MSDSQTVLRAFLFTDIVAATALKQRLGDAGGAAAIEAHDAIFRACLAQFGGEEQDNPGDGFFASFKLPSDALRCALAFQHRLAGQESTSPLQIRVGIHMGETIRVRREEGESKLLGLAIDTTARVMALALPNQILLTRHAFDSVRQQVVQTAQGAAITWLAHGQYKFKGVEDPLEIFEAGLDGASPLKPPPETESARRVLAPGEEETLGWRPAVGLPVPGRDRWVLERKLGEGGFGEVWLARHEETQYVRTFKFCQDPQRLRSLKRELKLFRLMAEVLGDRPDIARLYEVRLQEPPYYLEMEYTAGGNLEEWADKQGGIAAVSLAARLDLMAQVGDALAAAHSVGIIHKDVKPANVLIHEERDGRLQVRLTDFGIGELVDTRPLVDMNMSVSIFTESISEPDHYGSMTGTRLYMAPELVAGEQASTRTDVFALGVLLFQVVTGDFKKTVAHGWERYVPDELLREDIAACIAGAPIDRLASPALLADRLRRFDQRRAQREAERRAARTEARRRRLLRLTTVGALLLMGVASVSLGSYWKAEQARARAQDALKDAMRARQLAEQRHREAEEARRVAEAAEQRAQQQRRRAEAAEAAMRTQAARAADEARKAEQVSDFLSNVLGSVQPGAGLPEDAAVRDMLDLAAARVAGELDRDPLVRAAVHETIAKSYKALGALEEARRHAGEALTILETNRGPDDRDTIVVLALLGLIERERGDLERADQLTRDAVERGERSDADADALAHARNARAQVLLSLGRHDESVALFERVLRDERARNGDDTLATITPLNNLAYAYLSRGQYEPALPMLEQALAVLRREYGERHPDFLTSLGNLAEAYHTLGRLDQAHDAQRQVLAARRDVLGHEHPETLAAQNNLAATLRARGDAAEAEALFRSTLKTQQRVLGDEHPNTLATMSNLAGVLREAGQADEAEMLYRQALAAARRTFGDDHVQTLGTLNNLAMLLRQSGRAVAAEPLLRDALERVRATLGPEHPTTLGITNNFASLLHELDRLDEAEQTLRELIAVADRSLAEGHIYRAAFRGTLGALLTSRSQFAEAETLLLEAQRIVAAGPGSASPQSAAVLDKLAQLYEAWGKPERAAECRRQRDAVAAKRGA